LEDIPYGSEVVRALLTLDFAREIISTIANAGPIEPFPKVILGSQNKIIIVKAYLLCSSMISLRCRYIFYFYPISAGKVVETYETLPLILDQMFPHAQEHQCSLFETLSCEEL
jgi:hypothetical protein